MKIVVDINLVFSAILNTQSNIGELILNSNNIFQFWSCHFLLEEINKHWKKLREISQLEEENLLESYRLINYNIKYIDEGLIPKKYKLTAYELLEDIDLKDIAFVALSEFQKAILWSGDKSLVKGLRTRGYNKVITTNEMKKLRERLE
jgi:predicted nucleic acid-binding protein